MDTCDQSLVQKNCRVRVFICFSVHHFYSVSHFHELVLFGTGRFWTNQVKLEMNSSSIPMPHNVGWWWIEVELQIEFPNFMRFSVHENVLIVYSFLRTAVERESCLYGYNFKGVQPFDAARCFEMLRPLTISRAVQDDKKQCWSTYCNKHLQQLRVPFGLQTAQYFDLDFTLLKNIYVSKHTRSNGSAI